MGKINCSLSKNKNLDVCKRRPRPLMPYFGGKQRVADEIITKFPEHKVYVEPFVGGGAVFWKNTNPDKFVINDKNRDVSNVYKEAKNNPHSVKSCNLTDVNKEKYNKIKNKTNKNACDTMRLHKHGFGGIPTAYADKGGRTFNNPMTEEHTKKLNNTTIKNQDFRSVMQQYDSKDTLHYLDPPYVKAGKAYVTHGVTPSEVCNTAKKMKGKVVISYDNNPEVKRACSGLKFNKLHVPYSAGSNKVKKEELLITNY